MVESQCPTCGHCVTGFEQQEWELRQATLTAARAEIARLRGALRVGAGAAINELVSRGLPPEWSPDAGIGTMLKALGCNSTRLDDATRSVLTQE